MGTGSFQGVKRPGRGVDHPPQSSAEVKGRVELYLYSTSGPSWPVLGWTSLYFATWDIADLSFVCEFLKLLSVHSLTYRSDVNVPACRESTGYSSRRKCSRLLRKWMFIVLSQASWIQSTLTPYFFNLLNPTGYAMHQQFNIQQLYVLPTLYLCVLYLSENKQRLVPLTV